MNYKLYILKAQDRMLFSLIKPIKKLIINKINFKIMLIIVKTKVHLITITIN